MASAKEQTELNHEWRTINWDFYLMSGRNGMQRIVNCSVSSFWFENGIRLGRKQSRFTEWTTIRLLRLAVKRCTITSNHDAWGKSLHRVRIAKNVAHHHSPRRETNPNHD